MNSVTARAAFCNTMWMYFRMHAFHWNVTGPNFPMYHGFFDTIYEEIYDSIDQFAEELRALGEVAPWDLAEVVLFKVSPTTVSVTDAASMIQHAIEMNNDTLELLNKLFKELSDANEQGFADFIASRIDAHKKHGWMLKATQ